MNSYNRHNDEIKSIKITMVVIATTKKVISITRVSNNFSSDDYIGVKMDDINDENINNNNSNNYNKDTKYQLLQ